VGENHRLTVGPTTDRDIVSGQHVGIHRIMICGHPAPARGRVGLPEELGDVSAPGPMPNGIGGEPTCGPRQPRGWRVTALLRPGRCPGTPLTTSKGNLPSPIRVTSRGREQVTDVLGVQVH
jgi:hypothetical protein